MATVEAINGAVCTNKGLLHEILGVSRVPSHALRDPQQYRQLGHDIAAECVVAHAR
jgi:hypothetical protein